MNFKIDWTSLIAGSKFTVFALLYFVFEGNFSSTSSRGAYICRGNSREGFCISGLGAYIWGGGGGGVLFSEFYGISTALLNSLWELGHAGESVLSFNKRLKISRNDAISPRFVRKRYLKAEGKRQR